MQMLHHTEDGQATEGQTERMDGWMMAGRVAVAANEDVTCAA